MLLLHLLLVQSLGVHCGDLVRQHEAVQQRLEHVTDGGSGDLRVVPPYRVARPSVGELRRDVVACETVLDLVGQVGPQLWLSPKLPSTSGPHRLSVTSSLCFSSCVKPTFA